MSKTEAFTLQLAMVLIFAFFSILFIGIFKDNNSVTTRMESCVRAGGSWTAEVPPVRGSAGISPSPEICTLPKVKP